MSKVFARTLPSHLLEQILWVGIDVSGIARPRSRTPEQFERWTHLVAIAHNHLVLARDLVEPHLRPWENKHRPVTPQHVHRAMGVFLPQLATPARHPQPRRKSPGRAKGTTIGKAQRFSVVKKTPKLPKLLPI